MALFLVGITLVILASVGSTIGIILMKKSFGASGEHANLKATMIWVAGLTMMVLGAVMDFVAFGFAAQSLIAPLGSTTLLCNVILSPIILGEKVANTDWFASAIIALGCTIAIAFGDHTTTTYEFEELMDLYDNIVVILYLPAVGVTIAGMYLYIYVVEKPAKKLALSKMHESTSPLKVIKIEDLTDSSPRHSNQQVQAVGVIPKIFPNPLSCEQYKDLHILFVWTIKARLSEVIASWRSRALVNHLSSENEMSPRALMGLLTPQAMLKAIPEDKHMVHGFCYAAIGGLAGSCSVLFGKSTAEIIKPGLSDGDATAWGRYETYLILIAMGCTLYVQMKGLNGALGYHPAVFVVPVYQTCWILGSIVGGAVYFKEFSGMSILQICMFCAGTIICLLGVFALTYFRWDQQTREYKIKMGLVLEEEPQTEPKSEIEMGVGVAPTSERSDMPVMGSPVLLEQIKPDEPPQRELPDSPSISDSSSDSSASTSTSTPTSTPSTPTATASAVSAASLTPRVEAAMINEFTHPPSPTLLTPPLARDTSIDAGKGLVEEDGLTRKQRFLSRRQRLKQNNPSPAVRRKPPNVTSEMEL